MKVSRLTVDPFTNLPVIILRDEEGTEAVPIWIGLVEASAIAAELEKIALDRPMTHDLLKTIIGESGLKVDRVEVHDVVDQTFYATIHLTGRGRKAIAVDARPSDAIALALRTGARICVAKKVIERVRKVDLRDAAAGGEPDQAVMKELLESLSDEEFGKWKM